MFTLSTHTHASLGRLPYPNYSHARQRHTLAVLYHQSSLELGISVTRLGYF